MSKKVSTIYLLHFDRPLHHARHYLGCTPNLERRLQEHRSGDSRAARIMQVIHALGIGFQVARTWVVRDGLTKEAHLKNHYKNSADLCPICRPGTTRGKFIGGKA